MLFIFRKSNLPFVLPMTMLVILYLVFPTALDWAVVPFFILTVALQLIRFYLPFHTKSATDIPEEIPLQGSAPKVAVHLAICNEPSDMVIDTIHCLLAQEYSNFEITVINNNTVDENVWKPVRSFCDGYDTITFYDLGTWPDYKSGALNYAMDHICPEVKYVFIVDADYKLYPTALTTAVHYAERADLAVVQFPQSYSNGEPGHKPILDEFDHFFKYYCTHANRCLGALATGTLSLIRTDALHTIGDWPTNSITEDAELGIRMQKAGFHIKFVDVVIGKGMAPTDQYSFQKQRKRWIFGNLQTLRDHIGSPVRNLGKSMYGFAQLTAWINLSGVPILILLAFAIAYCIGTFETVPISVTLSVLALGIIKVSRFLQFIVSYNDHKKGARAFLVHLANFPLAAFYWWPALFGANRPFERTDKGTIGSTYRFGTLYPLTYLVVLFTLVQLDSIVLSVMVSALLLLTIFALGYDYNIRRPGYWTLKLNLELYS